VVNLWKQLEYQSPRYRDWYEAVGEKQEVDSRDEVRHSETTDQLFVKMMVERKGRDDSDESVEGVVYMMKSKGPRTEP